MSNVSTLFEIVLSSLNIYGLIYLSEVSILAIAGLIGPLLGRRIGFTLLIAALLYTLIASTLFSIYMPRKHVLFNGMVVIDTYTSVVLAFAAIIAILDTLAAKNVVERFGVAEPFYAIMALNILGVLSVAYAGSEILIYTSWILAAVSSYVIVGLVRDSIAAEAAIKYGVMGAFATVLLLYALTLNMYLTGSLYLLPTMLLDKLTLSVFVFLVATSIGFKMGVVPFHAWLPDVYGNARPVLVAIVASSAKILATLFILKLLLPPAFTVPDIVAPMIAALAAVTMTYGNLAALAAPTPQHLLAYSAIAQAGYLLVGFAGLAYLPTTLPREAMAGVLLQVVGYAFAKSSAFIALDYYHELCGSSWSCVKGAVRINNYATLAIVLSLLTLLGVPPSLGFWGKLLIAFSIVSYSPLLILIMAVNIAISAYYYMKFVYHILFEELSTDVKEVRTLPSDLRIWTALASALLSLVLGLILPGYALSISTIPLF